MKNAINFPVYKAFDPQGKLFPDEVLPRWVGDAGVDHGATILIYDSYDGQNGSMLAWLLEYLGFTEVCMLNIFQERWVADSREIFYKPVNPQPAAPQFRAVSEIKATSDDLLGDPKVRLVDFRSREEYAGAKDFDGKPGHIPGAVNIVWHDVAGSPNETIFDKDRIQSLLSAAGIRPDDRIIAYCRTGPRAALGYGGLKHCGYNVRLYSGHAVWVARGLSVEV